MTEILAANQRQQQMMSARATNYTTFGNSDRFFFSLCFGTAPYDLVEISVLRMTKRASAGSLYHPKRTIIHRSKKKVSDDKNGKLKCASTHFVALI